MYSNISKEEEENNEITQKELSRFNWGACVFSFIWAIFNGALKEHWLLYVVQLICIFGLNGIPIIGKLGGLIGGFIIPIYLGIKGNQWAWNGKQWKDIDTFKKKQVSWAIGSIVFVLLYIVALISIIGGLGVWGYNIAKEKGGIAKITNDLIIKSLIKDSVWQSANSGEDYVEELVKSDTSIKKFNENTIISTTKDDAKIITTFYKDGDCNLNKENCYVMSYVTNYNLESQNDIIVKTYFGNNGKKNHIVLEDFPKPEPTEEEFIENSEE